MSISDLGKIYTDQTGRFPVTSSQGNVYILILYSYNTNAIIAKAIKSRTAADIFKAYETTYNCLKIRGWKPNLIRWIIRLQRC